MTIDVTKPDTILDTLSLLNRAYQVRYALGKTPEEVGGESMEDTLKMIELARAVVAGDRSTEELRHLSGFPSLMQYAATGELPCQRN